MSHESVPKFLTENTNQTLTRIYAEVFPRARTYIMQNSGQEEDARDIFQESLIAAWTNNINGRFSGDMNGFSAYLMQIVKYKWLNRLDSSEHRKTIYKDSADNLPDADSREALAKELEESTILQDCMESLDGSCKEILTRFYYKKESLQRIAAELSYTVESIKTVKYRCMQRLRKQFIEKIKSSEK